ncbi:MAG: hypothetical protein AAFN27_01920 [Pseudomonadota bacterium]
MGRLGSDPRNPLNLRIPYLDDDPFLLAMMLNIALVVMGLCLAGFAGSPRSYALGPWQEVDLALAATVLALLILIAGAGCLRFRERPSGS